MFGITSSSLSVTSYSIQGQLFLATKNIPMTAATELATLLWQGYNIRT
jgi:hypothetical protein